MSTRSDSSGCMMIPRQTHVVVSSLITRSMPTLDGGGSLGRWSPANALIQDASTVPEPSTIALAVMGGLIAIGAARKNRKAIA